MDIIDNFLPLEFFIPIKEMFCSPEFPWYWCDTKINYENYESLNPINNHQFSHTFFEFNERTSKWNINPILDKLQVNAIVRIKANLTVATDTILKYGFHRDNDLNCKTSIYYINTNDGYTELKDGTIIESVENRMLTFDSSVLHSGTTCTNEKRRIVMNFNYF